MTHLNLPFQIPGYRIVRRLGMGGMATVYLAVQESLKRPVAVKVLATERAPSDELAEIVRAPTQDYDGCVSVR